MTLWRHFLDGITRKRVIHNDPVLGELVFGRRGTWEGEIVCEQPRAEAHFALPGTTDGPNRWHRDELAVVISRLGQVVDSIIAEARDELDSWFKNYEHEAGLGRQILLVGVSVQTGQDCMDDGYMRGVEIEPRDRIHSFTFDLCDGTGHVLNVLMRNGEFDFCGIEG